MINDITAQELDSVDIRKLPPQLKVITRLIGIKDTYNLLSDYGGQDINIPTGKHLSVWLYKAVEKESADALILRFAGSRVTLPKKDKIVMQIRNNRIRHAKSQGEQSASLARRFNLTRRAIILICKKTNS